MITIIPDIQEIICSMPSPSGAEVISVIKYTDSDSYIFQFDDKHNNFNIFTTKARLKSFCHALLIRLDDE